VPDRAGKLDELGSLAEKVARFRLKAAGELFERGEADVAFGAFDSPDVCAVQPAAIG